MARTLDMGFEAIETPNESNDPYCGHLKMTWKRQTRRESNNDKWTSKQAHENMVFWELESSKTMFIHLLKLTY